MTKFLTSVLKRQKKFSPFGYPAAFHSQHQFNLSSGEFKLCMKKEENCLEYRQIVAVHHHLIY